MIWDEGKTGENRVARGGSWNNNAANCRSANRDRNTPDNRDNNVGFRLLNSPPLWPDGRRPRIAPLRTGVDPYPSSRSGQCPDKEGRAAASRRPGSPVRSWRRLKTQDDLNPGKERIEWKT